MNNKNKRIPGIDTSKYSKKLLHEKEIILPPGKYVFNKVKDVGKTYKVIELKKFILSKTYLKDFSIYRHNNKNFKSSFPRIKPKQQKSNISIIK